MFIYVYDTGQAELVIFDTRTGQAVLDTSLPGLGKLLGSVDNVYDIWSVDWVATD